MDSLRGFEEDQSPLWSGDDEPVSERPPEIGVDERRMHVRAYNYWVSLLGDQPFPSIRDVDPHSLEDFGPHSVLLDFSVDPGNPAIAFLGAALRAECGLDHSIERIGDVPGRSLLSRLTDHYLQIIANRAPIGFEAEFVGQRGHPTLYRGILMPLSSDGAEIDFVYGVINWKEMAAPHVADALAAEVDDAVAAAPAPSETPVWADGPAAHLEDADIRPETDEETGPTLSLWPQEAHDAAADAPGIDLSALDPDAGLADRLVLARDSAAEAAGADQRSRAALYRALGHAYDFARAAAAAPADYAELLDDAGLKAQARAPMTPVAKLVFGAGYDKTRLTEYAAALAWALREGVAEGGLAARLEAFPGGLKGVVAAERAYRRPAAKPDPLRDGCARLRAVPALAEVALDVPGDAEFVLLVARRGPDGLAIVAPVADRRLTEQAIRKSA
jgi:hypothetical protein